MKIKALTIFLGIIGFAMLMQSASGGRAAVGGMDCTGAPNSSQGCSGGGYCHSGGSFSSANLSVSIKDLAGNLVTEYMPGETYTVEFAVTAMGNPAGYGMQAVILDNNNDNTGDWTAATTANTQLVSLSNGREILEHQGISATGVFRGTWTAPTSGTGAVKIYASAVAVNSNGATAGDQVTNSITYSLSESTVNSVVTNTGVKLDYDLYPNPNNGVFYLKLNTATNERVQMQLIDIRGIVIAEKYWEGSNLETVTLSETPAGMYWVRLMSDNGNGMQTIPIIIK